MTTHNDTFTDCIPDSVYQKALHHQELTTSHLHSGHNGGEVMITLTDITEESIAAVAAFVESTLERFGVTGKSASRLALVADDVWCNIVRYSQARRAEIHLTRLKNEITLTFRDDGIAYNPLEAPEPDVTLSAEDRQPGGLGILLMRRLMDQVDYQYKDSRNCLTLTLRL